MTADISVIIPTFRRPRELAEALESVCSQSWGNLEIIVVDDSPEQSAREVVAQCGAGRILYVVNPEPSGGYAARVRNLGAAMATGRLVHFLDDDDRVPPTHYERILSEFETKPKVGVIFGRVEPFGVDEERVERERLFFVGAARRAARAQWFGRKFALSRRLAFDRTMLVGGAAMIRRPCIEAIGGFDPSLRIAEDIDFYARAIRRFGGYFNDRMALYYRIWNQSIMHTSMLDQNEVQECYRRIHRKFRRDYGDIDYFISKMINKTLFRVM